MLIDLVVRRSAVALIVLLAARAAFAQSGASLLPSQFEFAGSWAPLGSEDVQNDSVPVDYLGLALTDEGRTRALAYDESQKSMIERQCQGWGAAYMVLGPFGLRISSQVDPSTNRLVSYTIDAWEDWMAMTIWMDGRPRPSANALHTQAGFTTGKWEGGALAAQLDPLVDGVESILQASHELGPEPNFNESMYFNVYDPGSEIGGFFRLGNRANEGSGEMTCCIYLPPGDGPSLPHWGSALCPRCMTLLAIRKPNVPPRRRWPRPRRVGQRPTRATDP